MIRVENIKVDGFETAIRGMRNPLKSWDKSDSKFGITTIAYDDDLYDVVEGYIDAKGTKLEEHSEEWEKQFIEIECLLRHHGVLRTYSSESDGEDLYEYAYIGYNDAKLMRKLIRAGADEAKFLRQINVSMDITATRFWWSEYDTYKVGTVANSESTMHTLTNNPITRENFGLDMELNELRLIDPNKLDTSIDFIVDILEQLRQLYLDYKDKDPIEANRYWRALIELLPQSWLQKRTVTFNYQVARNMYKARKNHKLQEWRDFCKILYDLPYGDILIGA